VLLNPEIRNRTRNRENSRSAAELAGTEQLRKDQGPLFGADGQQIEDEQETPNSEFGLDLE
jgi:hypothetical protein